MLCLDREIKKHLKCMHFFEVFQLAKLEEIQYLKKGGIWNSSHSTSHSDSIPNEPGKPDNHDRLDWPYDPDGSDRPNNTYGLSRPNNPDESSGPGDLMTHTGRASLTTQISRSSLITYIVRAGPTTKMGRVAWRPSGAKLGQVGPGRARQVRQPGPTRTDPTWPI